MTYTETDIAAAYNELCTEIAEESKVGSTDLDALSKVAMDAEEILVNQLVREGMSRINAVQLVQESSGRASRNTPTSQKLLDEARSNRFAPVPEEVEAFDDAELGIGTAEDTDSNTEMTTVSQVQSVRPANVDTIASQVANVAATPANSVAGKTVVVNAERSNRLRDKIGHKIEMKRVCEVFKTIDPENPLFNFEIPFITWDRPHPGIPALDKAYNMEEESLATVLYALANRKSTAIVGPHGAGKTKLIEQVGARINMPVTVIPVDGQITRSELFGQEKIRSTPTGPESYFQYGILPMALEEPGIILFDEIDRADPSIQYACHSVYEQTFLLLMEHDGRRIPLHKFNRVFATANTKGRGSDDGMYGGDNEMSEATRDRFSLWIEIDYQSPEDDVLVLNAKIEGITPSCSKVIAKLASMIRNGYKQSALSQTCSMRQQLETGEMAVHFIKTSKASSQKEIMECLRRAIDRVILGRANAQDQNSIKEYLLTIDPALGS